MYWRDNNELQLHQRLHHSVLAYHSLCRCYGVVVAELQLHQRLHHSVLAYHSLCRCYGVVVAVRSDSAHVHAISDAFIVVYYAIGSRQ